jgi:hypothetical protein
MMWRTEPRPGWWALIWNRVISPGPGRCSHPRVEYLLGDALISLPPEGFDVVIISNVLEHLPERPEFLRKLMAAARPSCLLISHVEIRWGEIWVEVKEQ